MKALAIGAFLIAGCGSSLVDPCAGVKETCLTLQVEPSGSVTTIDDLLIQVSSYPDRHPAMAGTEQRLPVAIGLEFASLTADAAVTIDVTGYLKAAAVGEGNARTMLVPGGHQVIRITLGATALDLSSPDLGAVDGSSHDSNWDQSLIDASDSDLSLADLEPQREAAPVCLPMDPSDECLDDTHLHHCNAAGSGFEDVVCALGCSVTGHPHCRALYPTAPVSPADSQVVGLVPTILTVTTTGNTDTGAIDGIRTANKNAATSEVINGIAFHAEGSVGVFAFGTLTVNPSVTLHLTGSRMAALVSAGDLTVSGTIDAQGSCMAGAGGPGAGRGLGGGGSGGQTGDRFDGYIGCGGGGAGYGQVGATGGGTIPGSAGTTYGSSTLSPLQAGSGGGPGGPPSMGGGGGGAVQLVASGILNIGSGTAGGINAGGCGGTAGAGSGSEVGGGGGGGSGGAILLEALTIVLKPSSALAANGGGGGGVIAQGNGGNGGLANKAAAGAGNCGGAGGAAVAPAVAGQANCGGGGGVGRIRLNSQTAPSVDLTAVLSPPSFVGTADIH